VKPVLVLLLLLISGCTSAPQQTITPQGQRLDCYRLPPQRWGACLEQARAVDFNVYECERRALYGPRLKENPRDE